MPGNQEITRPSGNPGIHQEFTRKLPELGRKPGLPWSVVLWWATGGEKNHHFFQFLVFVSKNPRKKSRFWSFYGKILYYPGAARRPDRRRIGWAPGGAILGRATILVGCKK